MHRPPNKPVIAVDLDEVLAPFAEHMALHHNDLHGTDLAIEDFSSYRFNEVWGGTQAEAVEKVHYFFEVGRHLDIDPLPEAYSALKELNQEYKLVVVTARDLRFAGGTRDWLERHFPGVFERIEFCSHYNPEHSVTKLEMCHRLGARVLVDDNLSYAAECASGGLRALLFGDYPWNRTDELPEGVVRVAGWPAVKEALLNG